MRVSQTPLGPAITLWDFNGILVQQYIPHDTVTVYGVAMTFNNYYHQDGENFFQYAQDMIYNAVLMERTPGREDSIYYPGSNPPVIYRPLHYVDSLQVRDSTHIKYCHFQYEIDKPSPTLWEVPCYEFYFNTPEQIFTTADTFYVGRQMKTYIPDFYPNEFHGEFDSDPNTSLLYYTCTTQGIRPDSVDALDFFLASRQLNNPHWWGFVFPIIGFRCKPLDEISHRLVLSQVDGQGATVSWYNVEEGTTYNVQLVDIDHNTVDTLIVTTDTTIRFDSLPIGKHYNVQVRKQCHYSTVNYDTTVYSSWTHGAVRFSTAPDTTNGGSDTTAINQPTEADRLVDISPNPTTGLVQVTATCGMTEVCIYNPAGEQVCYLPVSGNSATVDTGRWPSGVYVVHAATPLGQAIKKLVVN